MERAEKNKARLSVDDSVNIQHKYRNVNRNKMKIIMKMKIARKANCKSSQRRNTSVQQTGLTFDTTSSSGRETRFSILDSRFSILGTAIRKIWPRKKSSSDSETAESE